MRKAISPPTLPAVSLRDLLHDAVKPIPGHAEPKVDGHKAHWMVTKIRAGEIHAAAGLQHLIDDMTARGKPLDEKLVVARRVELYTRATHPVSVGPVDVKAASIREEMACARVQGLQMRAMNPADVSDLDLDRLDAFLDEQIDATAAYQLEVKKEQVRRMDARADAMRRFA